MFCRWCKGGKCQKWDVPQPPSDVLPHTKEPTFHKLNNAPLINNNLYDVKPINEGVLSNAPQQTPTTQVIQINASEEEEASETETVRRRSGLAAHTTKIEKNIKTTEIVKYSKEASDEVLIKDALKMNALLYNVLEGDRLQAVVDAMYIRDVKAEETIISEGDVDTHLYISATGTYETFKKGESIATFQDNRVFGELAIFYNEKRQATIKVIHGGKLWVLDQNVYKQLMFRNEIQQYDQIISFLSKVPKLNTVSNEILGRVGELLKREFFSSGQVIIRQGEQGDKFYIIRTGTVTITKEKEGQVGKMSEGEFFGHLALLTEDHLRQATVTAEGPVECFYLSLQEFVAYFGNVEDIANIPDLSNKKLTPPKLNPYQDIKLKDLKRIETLGVGKFGRVELVQHKNNKSLLFARKALKKRDIIQQQQQDDVYNEKNIQMSCNSIFITKMFKTFKDQKYVYFLMELSLGGDLWSLLQSQKHHRFEEEAARYYAASVLEALSYLHERGIVYRDLKPENLLLDDQGHLKLTDFGIAKILDTQGKTYTFAGTPEYVAPEIILSKGYNRAVDYWGLGIFIFELLVGKTPFRSNDVSNMKTFNLILGGIKNDHFPQYVSNQAKNLIKKLCRRIPVERLGFQQEGPQAIRDHRWFTGFNWNRLRDGTLEAPFKRVLKNNIDTQYFDKFPKDTDIPSNEESGWDNDL